MRRTCPWQAVAAVAIALCCSACTTVIGEGAKKTLEDRQTGDFMTDTQIGTGLMSALAQKDAGLAMDVNIDVWEQRVMLTGTVADAKTRAEVVQMAREDKRAHKVYDEMQVVSAQEIERRRAAKSSRKEGFERFMSDYWIETKISAQLISTREVASVNLRWRSVRNTVYVIGRARSQEELRLALDGIRSVDGVQQVRSFIEVKKY